MRHSGVMELAPRLADVPSVREIRATFEPFLRKDGAKKAVRFGSRALVEADRQIDLSRSTGGAKRGTPLRPPAWWSRR